MRNRIIAGLLAIILVVGGWFIGSPLWTLRQMAEAARSRDAATFESYVDFPALRTNVRSQIAARIAERLTSSRPLDGFAALGAMLVGKAVDGSIDDLISPKVVGELFEARNGASGEKSALGISAADSTIRHDGLNQFRLVPKNGDGSRAVLVFTRYGLGWKLSGITLPSSLRGVPR